MRAHNYYAAPGFERAGLRRRDSGWIVERIADPASLFVPVWRNQNLIIEIDGGEPRAVVLGWAGLAPLIGDGERRRRAAGPGRNRLSRRCRGAGAFCARPVADRSAARHAALAGAGGERHRSRVVHALPICGNWAAGSTAVRHVAGAGPGDPVLARPPPLLRPVRQPDPQRGGGAYAPLHRPRLQHDAFPAHRPRRDHVGDPWRKRADGPLPAISRPACIRPWPALSNRARASKTRWRARCARRAGIEVGAVDYHSSQPWPFPANIMLGFHAHALTTEITVDFGELEDARWFERGWLLSHVDDDTFRLPRLDSIARRLLEDWLYGRVAISPGDRSRVPSPSTTLPRRGSSRAFSARRRSTPSAGGAPAASASGRRRRTPPISSNMSL